MSRPSSTVRVVGAVAIRGDGLVYVSQRPPEGRHGGLWEFPGGKVESQETDEAALRSEVREELRVACSVGEHVATGQDRGIELHCYRVVFSGEPKPEPPRQGAWFDTVALERLDMPPADAPARLYVMEYSLDST